MTTLHNNEFTFNIDGLTEIRFVEQDHKITNGQPYEGVTTKGNVLTVKAGRHNSGDVADWFLNKSDGGGVIAKTFNSTKPKALNFAVIGTLSLVIGGNTYTSENFVLGQGHFEWNNNWWIGSRDMFGVSWGNPDVHYAEGLVIDTLSLARDIISDDPVGIVLDSANLIVDILKKRKVGSGSIAFRTSASASSVELFLFQMENSNTDASMTGTYSHP